MFAAELSADITAEQGRWRAVSALRARQRLMRASACDDETAELVEGLGALRRSGDYRLLQFAVVHLHQAGPLEALAKAVSDVPLDGWKHSAAGCNFETVTLAGDLLDEETASGLLCWSLRLVEGDPTDFMSRVRPDFNLRLFALKAVTGLLSAASSQVHDDVARLIAKRCPAPQELVLGLGGAVGFLDFDPSRRLRARLAVGVRAAGPRTPRSRGTRLAGCKRQFPCPGSTHRSDRGRWIATGCGP